ncbi:lipopolysaccharide assembly LapA domain-containing protein [Roseateles sp.]|jgi:putative membrane protein|uniref:LapA family protein n=1 Tax=Roseateles sp. TaxID=1971397 RepID=UPI00391B6D49
MRVFVWLLRAFIFFALFAFALNNSQEAEVHWFFGHEWRAPMVIIVLVAFGCGAALGVLAMVPAWWKHRRVAQRQQQLTGEPGDVPSPEATAPNASVVRDGL